MEQNRRKQTNMPVVEYMSELQLQVKWQSWLDVAKRMKRYRSENFFSTCVEQARYSLSGLICVAFYHPLETNAF